MRTRDEWNRPVIAFTRARSVPKWAQTGTRGAHVTHKCSQIDVHGRPSGEGSTNPTSGLAVVVLGSGRGSLVTVD